MRRSKRFVRCCAGSKKESAGRNARIEVFCEVLPVAVAAGLVPALGMLMLPKTVCYILMVALFLKASGRKKVNE